ncbi:unnamed protein product (mitochondrion) [Plasmodiophora brassicae]|uniref:Casein kinase I n=1 Tax=Plasmodiophora brassicae TaxID=37360 RepID=A0A0G4IY82_PLABS|nr:hypothetical protein PBRA_008032 [Plasmodiophora brassicae]SPQ95079.1 unnamed protein product [Plasmodiophora brassicae]
MKGRARGISSRLEACRLIGETMASEVTAPPRAPSGNGATQQRFPDGYLLNGVWVLKRRVGQGRYSDVYIAMRKDVIEGSTEFVALKVDKADIPEEGRLLEWEASVLEDIQGCPGVCPMVEQGTLESGGTYIAMQLCQETISEYRKRQPGGQFRPGKAAAIVLSMLDSLEALHKCGYVHRDVKPSNFVRPVGSAKHECLLIDFGLARRHSNGSQILAPRMSADFKGTSKYASLNSHSFKELAPRDDIFSLLYVLVDFLLGRVPWADCKSRHEVALMKQKMFGINPVRLDRLPDSVYEMFAHLNGLRFADYPDYPLLRRLIHSICSRRPSLSSDTLDPSAARRLSISSPVVHESKPLPICPTLVSQLGCLDLSCPMLHPPNRIAFYPPNGIRRVLCVPYIRNLCNDELCKSYHWTPKDREDYIQTGSLPVFVIPSSVLAILSPDVARLSPPPNPSVAIDALLKVASGCNQQFDSRRICSAFQQVPADHVRTVCWDMLEYMRINAVPDFSVFVEVTCAQARSLFSSKGSVQRPAHGGDQVRRFIPPPPPPPPPPSCPPSQLSPVQPFSRDSLSEKQRFGPVHLPKYAGSGKPSLPISVESSGHHLDKGISGPEKVDVCPASPDASQIVRKRDESEMYFRPSPLETTVSDHLSLRMSPSNLARSPSPGTESGLKSHHMSPTRLSPPYVEYPKFPLNGVGIQHLSPPPVLPEVPVFNIASADEGLLLTTAENSVNDAAQPPHASSVSAVPIADICTPPDAVSERVEPDAPFDDAAHRDLAITDSAQTSIDTSALGVVATSERDNVVPVAMGDAVIPECDKSADESISSSHEPVSDNVDVPRMETAPLRPKGPSKKSLANGETAAPEVAPIAVAEDSSLALPPPEVVSTCRRGQLKTGDGTGKSANTDGARDNLQHPANETVEGGVDHSVHSGPVRFPANACCGRGRRSSRTLSIDRASDCKDGRSRGERVEPSSVGLQTRRRSRKLSRESNTIIDEPSCTLLCLLDWDADVPGVEHAVAVLAETPRTIERPKNTISEQGPHALAKPSKEAGPSPTARKRGRPKKHASTAGSMDGQGNAQVDAHSSSEDDDLAGTRSRGHSTRLSGAGVQDDETAVALPTVAANNVAQSASGDSPVSVRRGRARGRNGTPSPAGTTALPTESTPAPRAAAEVTPVRRRGRPKKNASDDVPAVSSGSPGSERGTRGTLVRKRGRPKVIVDGNDDDEAVNGLPLSSNEPGDSDHQLNEGRSSRRVSRRIVSQLPSATHPTDAIVEPAPVVVARKRGRPAKSDAANADKAAAAAPSSSPTSSAQATRRRGRPARTSSEPVSAVPADQQSLDPVIRKRGRKRKLVDDSVLNLSPELSMVNSERPAKKAAKDAGGRRRSDRVAMHSAIVTSLIAIVDAADAEQGQRPTNVGRRRASSPPGRAGLRRPSSKKE